MAARPAGTGTATERPLRFTTGVDDASRTRITVEDNQSQFSRHDYDVYTGFHYGIEVHLPYLTLRASSPQFLIYFLFLLHPHFPYFSSNPESIKNVYNSVLLLRRRQARLLRRRRQPRRHGQYNFSPTTLPSHTNSARPTHLPLHRRP